MVFWKTWKVCLLTFICRPLISFTICSPWNKTQWKQILIIMYIIKWHAHRGNVSQPFSLTHDLVLLQGFSLASATPPVSILVGLLPSSACNIWKKLWKHIQLACIYLTVTGSRELQYLSSWLLSAICLLNMVRWPFSSYKITWYCEKRFSIISVDTIHCTIYFAPIFLIQWCIFAFQQKLLVKDTNLGVKTQVRSWI